FVIPEELKPPATRTLPLGRSVAVKLERRVAIDPVLIKSPGVSASAAVTTPSTMAMGKSSHATRELRTVRTRTSLVCIMLAPLPGAAGPPQPSYPSPGPYGRCGVSLLGEPLPNSRVQRRAQCAMAKSLAANLLRAYSVICPDVYHGHDTN